MKKLLLGLTFLTLGLIVLVAGCGRVVEDSTETITITGTIYAADGTSPIGGCTVSINPITSSTIVAAATDPTGSTTTTASDGSFSLIAISGTTTIYAGIGGFGKTISVTSSSVDVALGDISIGTSDTVPSIAVILGNSQSGTAYDHIETIITSLGYSYDTITPSQLTTFSNISSYDIIFINCGSNVYKTYYNNASVIANLQNFVSSGGSLYVSDWAYPYVEFAFSSFIDFYGDDTDATAAEIGNAQDITATVLDSSIVSAIGKTSIDVKYEENGWVVINSIGTSTTNLIRGTFTTSITPSTMTDKPLAVQFASGSGTVIYTSFHNETQATDDMKNILKHYIFTL